MALLEILTRKEQKLFDLPPQFLSADDRKNYFKLDEGLKAIVDELRGTTNKIGFILQLGYFRWAGRFFSSKYFHKKDLNFLVKHFNFLANALNIDDYSSTSYSRHQELILEYLGYSKFNQTVFTQEIERLTHKYIRPKQILIAIKEGFKRLKIELPSYHMFATTITAEYNKTENIILEQIEQQLTKLQIKEINDLLPINDQNNVDKQAYKRSILTGLRYIKQSLKPKDIKFNIQNFIKVKSLYNDFKSIIEALNLSKEAINYYAIWVLKARTAQVGQFASIYKRALYVISFIAFQRSASQDILVDLLLRSTQTTLNNIKKLQKDNDFEKRDIRNNSIKLLAECNNKSRGVLAEIRKIINTPILTDKSKVLQIKILIEENLQEFDRLYAGQFNKLEQDVELAIKGQDYFDMMEKLSVKLQLRVSDLVKQLIFNPNNSEAKIMEAINYYKAVDGKIDNKAPTLFLDKTAIAYLYDHKGNIKISLYKALLFINIAEAIKSGNLNLIYSYRYLSIDEYLIDQERWKNDKMLLLARAGMLDLLNLEKIIKKYKKTIENKFEITNQNILNNKNQYLKFKEDGNFVVKTPAVEKPDTAKTSTLFENNQYIPIIQVLEAINNTTEFVNCFKHYAIKHNKKKPLANIFLAGILALGCNIGIRKIANTSVGINESTLVTTCNWYFTLDNVNAANDQIINLINKLSLPNIFIKQKYLLHISGDGQKITVNANSLNANYSFKYSGNSQGASVYTFIDERQILFHSLVFSSAEREAAFVVDGLLCNEEIQTDIFSTDTHGFSEIIFAIIELLGMSFAPRIKKSQDQLLYSFQDKKDYNKGYKILPDKRINEKIISNSWDDILRLMVTIKLKETTASQIFKRLSSYASEHPLYKALKEFGRIVKTGFLLTYFDDVTLRQMIQKQLNKIELANKFSGAVFFANNQEFMQPTREDQEIATSCKRLIQNAIILWNYLFLSKMLAECKDSITRDNIINIIVNGSILCWGHFNLLGEYDFSEKPEKDNIYFDLEQILALKVA
jgi:TnpA family transposase